MMHWIVSGGVAALSAIAGYAMFRYFHPPLKIPFAPQEPGADGAARDSIKTEASRVEGSRRLADVLSDIESGRRSSDTKPEVEP